MAARSGFAFSGFFFLWRAWLYEVGKRMKKPPEYSLKPSLGIAKPSVLPILSEFHTKNPYLG